MAAGYARFRPPIHRKILESALASWSVFDRALDVGCGAGASTHALAGFAHFTIGMETVAAMLEGISGCMAGAAEAIPLSDRSIDLITAAGSLNYVDLELFFGEAVRVLRENGLLVVYDFEPGRSFPESTKLDEWFQAFTTRYPWPPHEAQELNPEILSDCATGFRMKSAERFELAIPLAREFYLEYMLTETNVAFALQNGMTREDVRAWCVEKLDDFWSSGEREIVFRGYYACLSKT